MNKLQLPGKSFTKSRLFCSGISMLVMLFFFSSCSPVKNSFYFKTLPRDTILAANPKNSEELTIKKNDLLLVNISSLNPAEDMIYNALSIGTGSSAGYLVDGEGNIQYHRLGVLHVEGMTRSALKNKLQKELSPYLKDPVVTVRFNNHQILVFGEVGKAQVFPMPEEQVSLFEVLVNSGDLTQYSRRDNILVIRETAAGKQFKRINLENNSIFTSSWYWLQPGDMVYVEPNDKRMKEEKTAKRQQSINLVITGISLALILLNRFFP